MRVRRFGGSRLLLATLVLLLSVAERAGAGPITWGPPTTITGDTDVSTDGTLIGAFSLGGPDVPGATVNGVTFAPLSLQGKTVTSGDFTFQISTAFLFNDHVGSTSPPFSTLSPGYQALVSHFVGVAPITLTIDGLTPGHMYEFEWWSSASSLALSGILTTAAAGNGVDLNLNTTGQVGGVGQFAIGTFTADGPTEVITFTGHRLALLDALELREIPEPSSLALFALGGAVAVAWRRWRARLRSV